MDFILGILTAPLVLVSLLLLGAFLLEFVGSNQTSAVLTVGALATVFIVSGASLLWLIAYIPVGLIWAVYRWRVHCMEALEDVKAGKYPRTWTGSWRDAEPNGSILRGALEHAVSLQNNAGRIVSWILNFPISFLDRVLHDLVVELKLLVTTKLSKLFSNFSDKALREFDNK